jgi:hypothetical protein
MSETRKVFIAIPAHDGAMRVSTVMSLISMMSEGTSSGITFDLRCWEQDSLIPNARNSLVGGFMLTDCTDMLFIDSDVSWGPGTLRRILDHKVDFVGGTYRFKREPEGYPVGWLNGPNDPRVNGLVEVARLPSGFFRMTRAGLQRVIDQCDDLAYQSHCAPDLKCWYLYDIKLKDGQLIGEDYVFCDLLRQLGESVWLDPELKINHAGSKIYQGNLDAFIAEQSRIKLPAEQRAELEGKLLKFAESLATPEMDRIFRQAMGQAA